MAETGCSRPKKRLHISATPESELEHTPTPTGEDEDEPTPEPPKPNLPTLPLQADTVFMRKENEKHYPQIPKFDYPKIPIIHRLRNGRITKDFIECAKYYQKFDAPTYFPQNLKFYRKRILSPLPSRDDIMVMETEIYDEDDQLRMNCTLKEVFLSDIMAKYQDCKVKVRQIDAALVLDLCIVKFLKHKNILSALHVNTEPASGSYQVVFPVHTTMFQIMGTLMCKFPDMEQVFHGTRIPRYVMRMVGEGVQFLHERRITVGHIRTDQVFVSPKGEIRLGNFERHCTMRVRHDDEEPEEDEQKFDCKALATFFMELSFPKHYNENFYRRNYLPSHEEAFAHAQIIKQYWDKKLNDATAVILLNEQEIDFVLQFYDENTTIEEALKMKRFFCRHDASADIVKLLRSIKANLPNEIIVGKQIPPPLPLNDTSFLAENPIVEFVLECTETTSFRRFTESFLHEVEYPHRLFQSLFEMCYVYPNDILPLSAVMFDLIGRIEDKFRENTKKKVEPGHFSACNEISVGQAKNRAYYIVARLQQCKSVHIKKSWFVSEKLGHPIFKNPGI
uniref:Protein kinase domain-containing protein n=1 Tax=Panagrellus redivivus TaxID=6233 RepID=A0A7E4V086_PANRE